jgi:uncharacterized protein (DUF362 family)
MSAITPGARVCLAVGSRGIDRIDEVVAAAVERVREAGSEVLIVPAMGSHGGATAEGQLEVLASYGITPDAVGCEIRSSMESRMRSVTGARSRSRRSARTANR